MCWLFVNTLRNEKVYKFSMTTTWGETTIALIDAANNIAKMANGRIVINVDSGNKYKAPLGILDMVKGGEYDMWSYILILLER